MKNNDMTASDLTILLTKTQASAVMLLESSDFVDNELYITAIHAIAASENSNTPQAARQAEVAAVAYLLENKEVTLTLIEVRNEARSNPAPLSDFAQKALCGAD
jgi:hypothetical protein